MTETQGRVVSPAGEAGIQMFQRIDCGREHDLAELPSESRDVIVISTGFDPANQHVERRPRVGQLTANSVQLLQESARILRPGGLLFVYGLPQELAWWGERLALTGSDASPMVFKYWIALDCDDAPPGDFLKPTHLGLLLYLKARTDRKSPTPFRLNTAAVRVPHSFCAACGRNLKDWGGKKHLMNPRGAALSDVWRDLPRRPIRDGVVPGDVLNRIALLTSAKAEDSLHVVQNGRGVETDASARRNPPVTEKTADADPWEELASLETNHVYLGDCVSFLNKVRSLHPHGAFDLVFADPPYNLEKGYGHYGDALVEKHYIAWSNAWLDGMAGALKPGGSLFVLNLPRWAIHHAAFLHQHLEFRHWIAWDALSDPRGKLMPAHYALLYYTKPGGKPVFNYSPPGAPAREGFVRPPDAPKYCLRAGCLKERRRAGDDDTVDLTDVWSDIHRIKHKRDRDAHPCQLPEKLMERIIRLTTRPGDVVFDPFCGAGTTAMAATKLGRKFVVVDLDPNYVRITKEKLAAMKQNVDLFGTFDVSRASVARPRGAGSKRGIELYLQKLARKLGRVPTAEDVEADRPEVLREIDRTYATRNAAFKRAKVVLENQPAV